VKKFFLLYCDEFHINFTQQNYPLLSYIGDTFMSHPHFATSVDVA